jgi:predicted nuclease of restriction endonuclease-like RecB superfamily
MMSSLDLTRVVVVGTSCAGTNGTSCASPSRSASWYSDLPGFRLQHRTNPARRWLLEIVGFWTPEDVARKLARYRSARLVNLILCIDEARNCAAADFPSNARVVRFRRWVNPVSMLRLVSD